MQRQRLAEETDIKKCYKKHSGYTLKRKCGLKLNVD